jgi:hypothetical protein
MRTRIALLLTALLLPAGARAQDPAQLDPKRTYNTRQQLEDMLVLYEQMAESDAYSRELRSHARDDAALIRSRLRDGDFQIGDRVVIQVEGQPLLSDTVIVATGPVITLPDIGDIPLAGVLRAELPDHLRREIARFVREPVVRAYSLIPISIMGDVGNPGFFVVPAHALITDALMLAGGPGRTANLDGITIERGDDRIWDGERIQELIIEGKTLDYLGLRAGDRIVVPSQSNRNLLSFVPLVRLAAFTIPSLILLFGRIF